MFTKLLTLFTFAAVATADFNLPPGASFHIVSTENRGLCVGYPIPTAGVPAILLPCNAPPAAWTYPGDGRLIASRTGGPTRLALTPSGSSIRLVPASADPVQIWTYNQDQTLRTASGLCATRSDRNVVARPCRASDSTQTWSIRQG